MESKIGWDVKIKAAIVHCTFLKYTFYVLHRIGRKFYKKQTGYLKSFHCKVIVISVHGFPFIIPKQEKTIMPMNIQ